MSRGTPTRRIVALAAAATLAATFVAGCSSSGGSADQGAAGAESTPVGDTMEGDRIEITDENLAMLAPIVVVPDQTEALANFGDGLELHRRGDDRELGLVPRQERAAGRGRNFPTHLVDEHRVAVNIPNAGDAPESLGQRRHCLNHAQLHPFTCTELT